MPAERWSADVDLQYAVAKALHKAGYGEDYVEMHDAAVAAINVVQGHRSGAATDDATEDTIRRTLLYLGVSVGVDVMARRIRRALVSVT
jgi:hypothetical protein